MEIKLDLNAAKVRAVSAPPAAERPPKTSEVRAEFKESAALEKALQGTADVRPEAVERAKRLVGEPSYPPRETIQKIANLLALKFSAENKEI